MKHKILVIDDDRDLRDFLQQAFSAAGFQVETVDRGAIGLRKLLTEDFQLVLIDLNMAEISGPNICRALRKHDNTRDLPVVMVTSIFHSPEQIAEAKENYGADGFLLKPFNGQDLQNLLERVFSSEGESKKDPKSEIQPLSDYTIPLQLQQLYREKATGLLHLQRGDAKKIIYIKDGYPIFARSNVLSECLGRMLVAEGIITQVDCDQSVERSTETRRLQGTVLIEMGLLTPHEVQEALIRQVTNKLLSTFAWKSGTCQFVYGKDFKKNVTKIKLTPAALIMQGIDLYWTAKQLDDFLFPFSEDYLKQSGNPQYRFQDIQLSKRGMAIFNSCKGGETLDSILAQHPLARREIQKILAALMISEMLDRSTTPDLSGIDDVPERAGTTLIDEKLRQKILGDYKRIMDADYFETLGLSRQCGPGEVRKAYYQLAKEYHPDRFLGSDLSNEMRTKINEMFQYITQAYTVLSDPDSCSDYLDELVNGPKKSIDISQVIEAETCYQEGTALLKVRRYKAAAKALQRAIELSPGESEYMTYFALALFKSDPEKADIQNQAVEVLLTSREINPGFDLTHLYLGQVYQAQGKERQAEKSFEMAVQANPSCTEALRELRLMNLRREQAPQSKGMFKKFLKKKS
ncbi:Response regulator containing CheY-like receiver, AAA-type ATPase, and DNA-binding domains [Desulfuromusa kysingii]|uniref:Response regulator containing CheY-like receiver, AAA-type ATPase, and DNA-binding domains n=1 Tax=Desulfuromusa kysingii TaxID=37625 RepID=A0A1H4DX02_9BACT|nr:response regulator [Desulfuromusa kysingii]SEA76900.1 Response regulator containing CheY-like receiver, AAA-type ATPase, and DNA-binding domains [Desulfuromusa kysingii]